VLVAARQQQQQQHASNDVRGDFAAHHEALSSNQVL
jgi:hypothetical protein